MAGRCFERPTGAVFVRRVAVAMLLLLAAAAKTRFIPVNFSCIRASFMVALNAAATELELGRPQVPVLLSLSPEIYVGSADASVTIQPLGSRAQIAIRPAMNH